MEYAVIECGGKQYKVSEGAKLQVDRLPEKISSSYQFEKVLLIKTAENIYIGTPYVEKASVVAKILSHDKGQKIYITKFKAKVNYRRKIGFRPYLTQLLIEKINLPDRKTIKAKKESKKREQQIDSLTT